MKETILKILKLTLTLLIICAGVAAVLAGVNAITKDKIAAINVEKTNKAIKAVLGESAQPQAREDLLGKDKNVLGVWEAENGYAVKVKTAGFNNIVMMVGVDANKAITGISVVSHAETSGIGTKVTGNVDGVLDQFKGMSGAGTLAVGTNVDAISGATVSSKGVTSGVNAALAVVEALG